MKLLTGKLGHIIVVIAAVALLISVVAVSTSPVSTFFENVVDKETGIAQDMMDSFGEPFMGGGAGGSAGVVMLEGDGQVVNKSLMVAPLRFRSSADVNTLQSVVVNGEVVDPSNYTVKEGSTIVTFNHDYVQSLDLGESNIEVVSEDGTATADFTVTQDSTLPNGATYTTPSGEVFKEGDVLPTEIIENSCYAYGDYKYYAYATIDSDPGWHVEINTDVTDTNQTSYGPMFESINGRPVNILTNTFTNCTSLTVAPTLPSGVQDMTGAFQRCTSLTTAPELPSGVKTLERTFVGCTSLTDLSDFIIPDGVRSMGSTFSGCTSLTTAPVIPSSVSYMPNTFYGCTSLTGQIEINAIIGSASADIYDCFRDTVKPIALKGSSPDFNRFIATANNYNVLVGEFEFSTPPELPDVATATISFADKVNRTSYSTEQQIWEQNGIKVTNNKASSTTNVSSSTNPVRFQKDSETIIEYPGMTYIEIDITGLDTKYASTLLKSCDNASFTPGKVIITLPSTADSYTITMASQVRANGINIYTVGS